MTKGNKNEKDEYPNRIQTTIDEKNNGKTYTIIVTIGKTTTYKSEIGLYCVCKINDEKYR